MDKAGQGKKESHSRSAQDIYRAIFDNVNDAIFLRDLKTMQILDVNSKLCEMTGYTAREIKRLPRGWLSASPLQDGKTIADYYADAANGEPQLFEWQTRKKDGTLFWVETNVTKVAIGDRECLLSVLRDSTQRRQEQEELRQSQARYRNIVEDQAEFLVCHFLADGTMTFVNEALCRCAGVRREELAGRTFWRFIAKEDVKRVQAHLAALSSDNPVRTIEHRIVTPDGRVRWLVWSNRTPIDGRQASEAHEFQAIGRDITLQKEAVEGLKESEKTLRALLDAITDPVLLLDVSRTIIALNEALARSIGKDPQEIVGTCIDAYLKPEVTVQRKAHTDSVARTGKSVRYDSEREGRYFEHSVYPVFDDKGQVTRIASYARDVTTQRQAQNELEAKSRYLEEMNTALKVLLNQRELDRKELEERVLSNVTRLILPFLHRLRNCGLNEDARVFLDVLETNVNEVISPFLRGLVAYQFTPRELEVISPVREGRTAKEIARLLHVCKGAVDIYRHHIRKKLGITTVKTNLRSHLLSLSP